MLPKFCSPSGFHETILAPKWKSLLFDFPKCLPTNLIFSSISSLVAGDIIPFVAELESGGSGGSGGLSILHIMTPLLRP